MDAKPARDTERKSGSDAVAAEVPFELRSLSKAHRYQLWLHEVTRKHLGSRILELGSGIGNMSQHLPVRERLILTDINPALVKALQEKFESKEDSRISVLALSSLNEPRLQNENLDTVVSFNVLEHVKDDAGLLRDAIHLLRLSSAPGPKRIVTLVPAHQWAYGPVDEMFGHFRRYSDRSFREALEQAGAKVSKKNYISRYMNIPALLGWCLNGRILKRNSIGDSNLTVFETLCPIIKPLDNAMHNLLKLPLGNSLITVFLVDD